MLLTEDEVFMG